ncbi:galactose oxidase [Thelephora ganbajun]|uniref:Galactose oxidase n=1 Tax=Thelephora ganbajun TaxID=370292 RepID=A0ACB6Z3Z4_THEGA|nr:galactose oxidase [Thelephora ganbajun]
MAKKKPSAAKAKAKAEKKARTAQKVEKKEKKKSGKSKLADEEDDNQDLEGILDQMRREWEEAHRVTEELVEGPPSRRANATFTASPDGNYIWAIGGEFFSDDGKAYFYNDVFRYSPEKDEWRKFVSPTCPGPRSAHAVVATSAGGGKLFLFGGEFSSLYQNSFHHYRDFWYFDISTQSWDRIDTKTRPTARSGHRMAIWKHYIVLFGGFYDPGYTTNYLNDLWLFDIQEYEWKQIVMKDNERKPSPRSGFSFLPTPEGIILHGGYCKEYSKGKRPIGVMLDDTWFLKLSLNPEADPKADPLTLKWERRKRPSTAFAPSLRSGCTMTLWAAKGMGIMFGGVTDEDKHEETLESMFHNDLYGYQMSGNGRWVSLLLKKPKQERGKKKAVQNVPVKQKVGREDGDYEEYEDEDEVGNPTMAYSYDIPPKTQKLEEAPAQPEVDPNDPVLTTPAPRYNAMLAVLRNTLYIYGGIFERGSKEYTLDDFYALHLDKMDKYVCLKKSDVAIPVEGEEESSSDEDDRDDEEDEEDGERSDGGDVPDSVEQEPVEAEEEVEAKKEGGSFVEQDLRAKATQFLGVSKDAARSPEDVISTPLPGETLAMFYARSREHWTQKAYGTSDNRGKLLRRDGFALAEERYAEYKPILEEVERILMEAGLDEEEMKRSATGSGKTSVGQSRNRR